MEFRKTILNSGLTRKEIEENAGIAFAQFLPADKYESFMAILKAMSDIEFEQIMAEFAYEQSRSPVSCKDYFNAMKKGQAIFGTSNEPSAMKTRDIPYMPKAQTLKIWNELSNSHPSDTISLSWREDEVLQDLWEERLDNTDYIPSDLFFADTLPLMDCEITVDESDKDIADKKGTVVTYRVTVFPDYRNRINDTPDAPVSVGVITVSIQGAYMLAPFSIVPGFDTLLIGSPGVYSPRKNIDSQSMNMYSFMSFAKSCLSTWYGIQIALLHPVLKEIFSKPKQLPKYVAGEKNKKKKRKVRYIRQHVIKDGTIDNILSSNDGSFGKKYKRNALAWYVIGHWRHYGDGRKVFVKGYWKGALRNLKKNLDEGRDRDIAYPN